MNKDKNKELLWGKIKDFVFQDIPRYTAAFDFDENTSFSDMGMNQADVELICDDAESTFHITIKDKTSDLNIILDLINRIYEAAK